MAEELDGDELDELDGDDNMPLGAEAFSADEEGQEEPGSETCKVCETCDEDCPVSAAGSQTCAEPRSPASWQRNPIAGTLALKGQSQPAEAAVQPGATAGTHAAAPPAATAAPQDATAGTLAPKDQSQPPDTAALTKGTRRLDWNLGAFDDYLASVTEVDVQQLLKLESFCHASLGPGSVIIIPPGYTMVEKTLGFTCLGVKKEFYPQLC